MRKVIKEFSIGPYKVLTLDGALPNREYHKYIIDDTIYGIIPIYDIPNSIAVKSKESFIDKTVKFE